MSLFASRDDNDDIVTLNLYGTTMATHQRTLFFSLKHMCWSLNSLLGRREILGSIHFHCSLVGARVRPLRSRKKCYCFKKILDYLWLQVLHQKRLIQTMPCGPDVSNSTRKTF